MANFIKAATDRMKEKGTLGSFGKATPSKIARAKKEGGKMEKKAIFAENMKHIAEEHKHLGGERHSHDGKVHSHEGGHKKHSHGPKMKEHKGKNKEHESRKEMMREEHKKPGKKERAFTYHGQHSENY